MKKLIATALLGAGLLAGTAQAEQVGGLYVGITGGVDKIDVDDLPGVDFDDGDVVGVLAGMRFANGLAIELAGAQSEADTSLGCQLDLDTLALYGAWRSSGTVYFKARVGLLKEEADLCGASEDDSGLSLGAGAGVRFGMVAVEAEYTVVEEDVGRAAVNVVVNF